MSHFLQAFRVSSDFNHLHDDSKNCDQSNDLSVVDISDVVPPSDDEYLENVKRVEDVFE